MTTILLAVWILVLSLAAVRPASWRRISLVLAGATLLLSPFWLKAVSLSPSRLVIPCVWFLVLWPMLRRRLTLDTLVANAVSGLIAAATIALVLDDQWGVGRMLAAWLSLPAGLALSLFANPRRAPWEYPAWHFGWLAVIAE